MPAPYPPSAADTQQLLQEALANLRAGRVNDALGRVTLALRADPDRVDALNLLSVILNSSGRANEALPVIERAAALAPDQPGILANLGMVQRAVGKLDAALVAYGRVLDLDPSYAPGYANRAAVLFDLRRYEAALSDYERALELRPDHPDTLYRRAIVLNALRRTDEAIAAFGTVLARKPDHVEALTGRGDCYRKLNQIADALADYRAALALRPNDPNLPGLVLRQQLKLCDWTDFAVQSAELARKVAERATLLAPFASLSTLTAPNLQLKAARTWHAANGGPVAPPLPAPEPGEVVRLGYFTADLYQGHPTMLLMAEMLARHDRSRFHVTAFHFNLPGKNSAEAYRDLFDEMVALDGQSDSEAAASARAHRIDIAIDVDGYTRSSRPEIFAHRAAPIQVSYLAYAGTLGVDHIDYLIADPTLIRPEDTVHYSEKIAWLPHSYQPRDTRIHPAEMPTRREAGLPDQGFVFCSFNATYKITPDVFAAWMEILSRVPGSVLWLFSGKPDVIANLRREAAARGIKPERLIFASSRPLPQHLARLALADLVLDTLPYNAHTTASDALFAGVPLLTLPGDTFASRVGASLLTTLGLPELIAANRDDYVARAVAIGTDPEEARAVREKLAIRSKASPLFDMARYTHDLEAAYEAMLKRAAAGLPAESFRV